MDAKDNNLLEKVDFDAAKDLAEEYKDSENYWFSKGVTVVGFIVPLYSHRWRTPPRLLGHTASRQGHHTVVPVSIY